MYELLYKLTHIINNNFSEDFNKIENVIKSNELYMNLDMDEQELLIENAREKHIEILEKKNNLTETNPSYKDVKPLMKKTGYNYGHYENIPDKIKLDDWRILTEGEIMSDRVKAVMINEPTPEDLVRRAKIFEDTKIKSFNMPLQKSEGWHRLRKGRIGGSECGTVLDKNKHQAQYTFILDKVLGAEFKGNEATYHGNVFEDVVRMMYEYNNNVHTEEFSSMPHYDENVLILSASPDGIVSPYERDMVTPTKLVGRMLEIKCPTMRKIKYSGDIKDTICPIYYWCQIQQQLECLNLDECDFIQCNIERYPNRDAWLLDTNPECDFKSAKYNNPRGIIIELIPTKLSESDFKADGSYADMTIWTKTKCLFPPKIDMSLKELDDWVLNELNNLPWGFTLHKIIYWRLIEQNCTLILRNSEWFQSQLPTYNRIWGYVEYLRANMHVCIQWKNWIDIQKQKYNGKIIAKLEELIEINEKSKLEQTNTNNIDNNINNNIDNNINNNNNMVGISNESNITDDKIIENPNLLIANTNDIVGETKISKPIKPAKLTKSSKSTKSVKSTKSIKEKKGITIDLSSDSDA